MNSSQVFVNEEVEEEHRTVLKEIHQGLSQPQKTLPAKLFYDEKGSELFDEICELEEYYPTRTEIEIMQHNIDEIAEAFGPQSALVEFGSGSSLKTRLLLDHLEDLAAYVPMDISEDYLYKVADDLQQRYPDIEVAPLAADYTRTFSLPILEQDFTHWVAYFPGSTIGNFTPQAAIPFLCHVAELLGKGGGFLIGADLQKDAAILNAAYDDAKGVTAEFNLNMLIHINREYDGNFDLDAFAHRAFYNEEAGRIEMHLVSLAEQEARIGNRSFDFSEGETILSEVSYKYTVPGFEKMVAQAGFRVEKVWTDEKNLFSVQYMVVN